MLFNSITFVVFLAVVYSLYRVLPHRAQNALLLIGSYVFYGWWDVRFLFLLILQTVIHYSGGLLIHNGSMTRRERLVASLWLISSAFTFLVIRWTRVDFLAPGSTPWRDVFSWQTGWLIFSATCIIVLAANMLYPRLASMEVDKRRKLVLILSIGSNVLILGFFKYFNFFVDNLEILLRGFGLNTELLRLTIVLPVGISFYTFQALTYTIDIYRRKLAPTTRFSDFALFLAFFPQLLAGPIGRAVNLLPQIEEPRTLRAEQTMRGLHMMFYGLFKKVVIADGVVSTVNQIFAASGSMSWLDALAGTFLFAIQIYCDFSGYSDMAIGTASFFGIELMQNFRFPYFARTPSDFWSRWHISLSSWFRDYIFFPLGGPYGSTFRWIRNLLVTFFITGLWHGAAWNYILWGLYHGCLICLQRLKESMHRAKRRSKKGLAKAASIAFVFLLTSYGWILFRSRSLQQIWDITSTLLRDVGNLHFNAAAPTPAALVGLPIFLIAEFIGYSADGKPLSEVLPVPAWTAIYAAMIFALILGSSYSPAKFIYFVF